MLKKLKKPRNFSIIRSNVQQSSFNCNSSLYQNIFAIFTRVPSPWYKEHIVDIQFIYNALEYKFLAIYKEHNYCGYIIYIIMHYSWKTPIPVYKDTARQLPLFFVMSQSTLLSLLANTGK